ncbi:MAG: histidine kinase dimerization/phosphoacceptor domain -containing protein [Methylocystis sp.]|uniref:histidine kinase dimerization/phosphoacceptor domain -containing protein n=1 Tax=Methylocystis sp. TaxID=1911079 RepID=UPI003DA27F2E
MPGEWPVQDLRSRVTELELELDAAKRQVQEYANHCAEQQHRVRNALQALSLLLSAQARTAQQPELCMRCITRLASVCELNEALCGDEKDISVAELLPALSRSIQQAFGDKVSFETQVENDVRLDHRRARCVGLIYSEAAMNALKHGLRDFPSGILRTTFRRLNKHWEMVVEDNGVGFDPPASVSGHGLGYMRELAKQLGGELEFERLQPGSRVRLTFLA